MSGDRFLRRFTTAMLMLSATESVHGQCDVYRLGVPDFDQRRTGLPGGGNCYCCPTSISNWFAYISNNGYPAVFLGPRDWQSPANYDDVTTLLGWVGQAMGTQDGVDPDGGGPLPANPCTTTFSGFVTGATSWLDSVAPGQFIAYTIASNGADTVTPPELAAQLAFGALVGVSYRGFTLMPPNAQLGLPSRWVLQPTGHVISMTRMTDACGGAGSTPRIWYRDPAGFAGDTNSQSPFVTQYSNLTPVPGFYASDAVSTPVFRTMYLMSNVSGTNMVNAICAVTPVHGLSAQPQLGQVVVSGMWNPDTLTIQPPAAHALPGAAGVVALRASPRVGQAMVLYTNLTGATQMGRLELRTASASSLVPLGAVTNPGPFVFTRSGRLIGLEEGNRLIYADISGASLVRSRTVTLSRPPVAIAPDDSAGQVILLLPAIPGGAAAAIQRADDATLALHAAEPLPAGVDVDSNCSIACDPGAGAIYIATSTPGAPSPLVRISRSPATGQLVLERVEHPHVIEPRSIQTTHRGTIVFESQGVCRALKYVSALGHWVADTDHPLAGQSIGPLFDLAASRSVIDSLDPDGAFDNQFDVDAGPGIPDCIADFDADGVRAVPDIFRFLSLWFISDRAADIDLDGDTDVPDIFAFLSAWFGGC